MRNDTQREVVNMKTFGRASPRRAVEFVHTLRHAAALRGDAARITWEHRDASDVREVENEADDALEADAASRMRLRAMLEGIDVRLNRLWRYALETRALRERERKKWGDVG